jgi:hypothetical protein
MAIKIKRIKKIFLGPSRLGRLKNKRLKKINSRNLSGIFLKLERF